MTRIFISHSHSDEAIARKLVDYLMAALRIEQPEEDIRCTSVPGHELAPGDNIEKHLRQDIQGDIVLIGLLTKNGLHSQWVLFELGAAWGGNKEIIPILGPGVTCEDLPGPLEGCIPILIEGRDDRQVVPNLDKMIKKLASTLEGITEKHGYYPEKTRNDFINELRAWKSQSQNPDLSQQKQIEESTKKLEESERSRIYREFC